MIIKLDATLSSHLNWDAEVDRARDGEPIVWEFDFGLTEDKIDLLDPVPYQAFSVAVEHFTKKIYPQFVAEMQTVSFGQLAIDSILSEELQERFFDFAYSIYHTPCLLIADLNLPIERKELTFKAVQNSENGAHLIRVYAFTVLSEYLHRLVALLPDSIPVSGSIDLTLVGRKSHRAQLLSKERFPHLQMQKDSSDSSIAVCLPQDQSLSCRILTLLDTVFEELEKQGVNYRIVSEFYLTEEWEGINQLIVITDALSPLGKRKLLGFSASGGEVIEVQSPHDLKLVSLTI